MLEKSILEFKVENLNFSKMWLDIHQNVKSRNMRIVRVLKLFLLVIRLEITENRWNFHVERMENHAVVSHAGLYEGESKSKGKIHLTALIEVTVINVTYHFST